MWIIMEMDESDYRIIEREFGNRAGEEDKLIGETPQIVLNRFIKNWIKEFK